MLPRVVINPHLPIQTLDLFLIHRPDVLLDAPAVGATLNTLKEDGKVTNVGVSNFSPSQMRMLAAHVDIVTNQVEVLGLACHFCLMRFQPVRETERERALLGTTCSPWRLTNVPLRPRPRWRTWTRIWTAPLTTARRLAWRRWYVVAGGPLSRVAERRSGKGGGKIPGNFELPEFPPFSPFAPPYLSHTHTPIARQIWSPVGGGSIFGDATDEAAEALHSMLDTVGAEMGGAGRDEVALAWLTDHPLDMVVVLGTTKLARVELAVRCLSASLTRQQWYRVWAAAGGAIP